MLIFFQVVLRGTTSVKNSRLSRRATAFAGQAVSLLCQCYFSGGYFGFRTDVLILDIFPGSLFRFDNFVRPFNKVLDEHFGSNSDHKGRIVGAVGYIFVGVYDFLYTSNCVVLA